MTIATLKAGNYMTKQIKLNEQELNKLKTCDDCENWRQRGDELFDELDRAYKTISSMEDTVETIEELRQCNSNLRKILSANNIEFLE